MSSRTASHTAVITGSTAGLGASFARQLAGQGYDVVLVARREDRLEAQATQLQAQYGVNAEAIVADLSTADGVGAVQERLRDRANPVHLLVNNAGHGLAGNFLDNELDDERDLLRLHVQTTMELCHTAAQMMTAQRGGRIINVASVAGFTPTGTYSAAKSWVINFSKGLHNQLHAQGVTVTVVCPGLVRTEFHQRSGISLRGARKWMWLDADDVVRQALTAAAQGAPVSVPSRSYQALTASLKFIPDSVVQWAADKRLGLPDQSESSKDQPDAEGAGAEGASSDEPGEGPADSSASSGFSAGRR